MFIDLYQYLQDKKDNELDINACFYHSDFIANLVQDIDITDPLELVDIISKTIYVNKEKDIVKECQKYLKKE